VDLAQNILQGEALILGINIKNLDLGSNYPF